MEPIHEIVDKLREMLLEHIDTPVDGPLDVLSDVMERKASKVLEDIDNSVVPAARVRDVALSAIKALRDFQSMVHDQAHTVLAKYTACPDGEQVGELAISFPGSAERIDLVKALYASLGVYLQERGELPNSSVADEAVREEMRSASRCMPETADGMLLSIGKIPNKRAQEMVRDIYEALYKHIPKPDKLDQSVMDNILTKASEISPRDDIKALSVFIEPLVEILKGSLSA